MIYDSRPRALVQATSIVYHCIMAIKDSCGPNFYMHWMEWRTRDARIERFRARLGIPPHIPDDVIVQAILEDWDLP